jgi:hypothetical protein
MIISNYLGWRLFFWNNSCRQVSNRILNIFSEIINDKSRPITARFIAMHILAHLLCADSDTNQLLDDTRRSTISNDILQLLDDCNIADTNLDIEYRSMKPFFRLIESKSNTAQYYAIWTIANLTTSTQHSMIKLVNLIYGKYWLLYF